MFVHGVYVYYVESISINRLLKSTEITTPVIFRYIYNLKKLLQKNAELPITIISPTPTVDQSVYGLTSRVTRLGLNIRYNDQV